MIAAPVRSKVWASAFATKRLFINASVTSVRFLVFINFFVISVLHLIRSK